MGQEAKCIAHYKGQSGRGTALLESDGIHYRGAFRLFIPAADLKSAKVDNGLLETSVSGEVARLELGSVASDWLHRILNPKSLLDKLGIKPSLEISVVGEFNSAFKTQLSSVTGRVTLGKVRPESDMVFFAAANKADLNALSKITAALKPRTALWIIYPKGVQTIRESDVSAAAKASGLVANKVVSFSPSHTGLRFVSTGRN